MSRTDHGYEEMGTARNSARTVRETRDTRETMRDMTTDSRTRQYEQDQEQEPLLSRVADGRSQVELDSSSGSRGRSTLRPRNVDGLRRHAQNKRREAQRRVDYVIQDLLKRGDPVGFSRIAALAGVSKSYLYTCHAIRERIEALRQQEQVRRRNALATARSGGELGSPGSVEPSRSDAAKEVLLAAKERRIQALEAENRRLQAELRVALGKLYAQA